MMRRHEVHEGKISDVRDAEALRDIEDDETDGFGEEESQILEDRLRNKVTDERERTLDPHGEDCKNRIAKRKSSNEGGRQKRKDSWQEKEKNKSGREGGQDKIARRENRNV